MIKFFSDHPDHDKGHVGGSQEAGDKAAIKSSFISFRAAKRKTQSTPTTHVVQKGSKHEPPARTYVVGPAGWLIIAIMVVMVVVAIARVVALRGAM